MLGILVYGNNHFILAGPMPEEAEAKELVRHWSVIRIGEPAGLRYGQWEIRTKEFREDLRWAVVVEGGGDASRAAAKLLEELGARGAPISVFGVRG